TPAEDANSAPGVILPVGASITWTYLVTNPGNVPLSGVTVKDDAGTSTTSDDFTAKYVFKTGSTTINAGDTDGDNLLDPGEVWLFPSTGAKSYTAVAGQYTGVATAGGTDTVLSQTVTSTDAANHFGAVPGVQVKKAINAVKPLSPTGIEEADAAPG